MALATSLMVTAPPGSSVPPAPTGAGVEGRVVEGYGNLPISFEPNVGQAPNRFDFVARGQGFGMAIDAAGATLALGSKDIVRLSVLGADRSARPLARESLPGVVNYFIGDKPAEWRSDVATYGRVAYPSVLPGINLTYYGTTAGTLEYDFVVAPGADPNDIRLRFSGASDMTLRGRSLVLTTSTGEVVQDPPVIYQTIGGRRVPVAGRFSLEGEKVGFEIGLYDHNRSLVIDPTLVYSTYLGGTKDDLGQAIAVDGHGAVYVTGSTTSTGFPTPAFPGTFPHAGQTDVFVTKLDPSGQSVMYSTFLGGSKMDSGNGIAVDAAGAVYVTGSTSSMNFPTQAAIQAANGGGAGGGDDAFVTKLGATGSTLTYSTYLGGSDMDSAHAVAIDAVHAVYVTGSTSSMNFPTASPLQPSNAGMTDAFVTKINDKGSALAYSTYLGGKLDDASRGIVVDPEGSAYGTGVTSSEDFPTEHPSQGANGGSDDAFVTKLDPAGSSLSYSTYLGGSGSDGANGIAIDGAAAAYVAGSTASTDFPTHAALQGTGAGAGDAFVTKLDPDGSGLSYSTYLGGSGSDAANGIAIEGTGGPYVVGSTSSTDLPLVAASQGSNAGSTDAFVTRLNGAGSALTYSTYLGGSDAEAGNGVAADGSGSAYVIGSTSSTNLPTLVPFQAANAGMTDAFVTRLSDVAPPTCGGRTVTIQIETANQTTTGTAGPDVMMGTPGIDTIQGLGGDDTICGLGGHDKILGGDGSDELFGGGGNDRLIGDNSSGGNGDDEIDGGPGNDLINGVGGSDLIDGDAGGDIINGDDGADQIHGGAEKDSVSGGPGNDVLHGDDGADKLQGDSGDDVLHGNGGNDILNTGLGIGGATPPDTLYGGDGNDILNGGAFGDKLEGGAGNDNLYGKGAWDKLYGGAGKDNLYGNDGNDFLNGGSGGLNNDYCDGGAPATGDTGTLCESSINIP